MKQLLRDLYWGRRQRSFNKAFCHHKLQKKVLLNTIPRSGSNLLKNLVLTIPGAKLRGDLSYVSQVENATERLAYSKAVLNSAESGAVFTGHIPWDESLSHWIESQEIQVIFLYRDPRDLVISLAKSITDREAFINHLFPKHPLYDYFTQLKSDDERLLACIEGVGAGQHSYQVSSDSFPHIGLVYDVFCGWRNHPGVLALRYEDLRCNALRQRMAAVRSLLEVLGLPAHKMNGIDINHYIERAGDPKRSNSFKRGLTQAWKREFKDYHRQAFLKKAGHHLATLNYVDRAAEISSDEPREMKL